MPPMWKIQRELKRVGRQFESVGSLALSTPRRVNYDLTKAARIRVSDGELSEAPNIALFLVYARDGLLGSHLHTLRHLVHKGFAPLLVVNHTLRSEDRQKVNALCWKILERPNVGYDFGGYRDGIHYILSRKSLPDGLLVLNDPTWFPLRSDTRILDEMKTWDEPLRGFNTHQRSSLKFRAHVQSYMFMFGRELLEDPRFRSFWRNMIFTNNKQLIIRYLEMRMTQHFTSFGYKTRSFHDYWSLLAVLMELDEVELQRLARDDGRMYNRHFVPLIKHMDRHPGSDLPRDKVEKLIRESELGGYLLKLPPEIMFDRLHVPLLKKDRNEDYKAQRAIIRERGYLDRFDPVVAEEIATWDD